MAILICDRAPGALMTEAIRYSGTEANYKEIVEWVGRDQFMANWGRHVLISPDASQHTFLDAGDWIIRGKGPGWDFYVVRAAKMRELWIPREGRDGG